METLLLNEKKLFELMREYFFLHQHPPSVRELIDLSEYTSSDKVQKILSQLREKEYIDWTDRQNRTYRLIAGNMPLRGVIQAGYVEQPSPDLSSYIDIPGTQYRVQDYALKVQGDSMIGDHICDGDFVIIRPNKELDSLKPGTITAVWIEGGGTTLKRLYWDDKQVLLKPSNPEYETQIFEASQVQPQGILIGLHRNYSG